MELNLNVLGKSKNGKRENMKWMLEVKLGKAIWDNISLHIPHFNPSVFKDLFSFLPSCELYATLKTAVYILNTPGENSIS